MSELHNKIKNIQEKLSVPKKQFNSFGNYHYRSAEDILEALKPLLTAEGLIQTLSDEPILLGDHLYIQTNCTVSDGENRITVLACARENTERKGMDNSQMTGSASSYARKYAMNGMWLIDDNKDGDFQPEWWDEAVKYLQGGGKIETIEKKYTIPGIMKERLMDVAAQKL